MSIETGFIGLGAMGEPMARNLHRAGHLVTVWNRTAAKAAALAAELGIGASEDPARLARQCELIVTCVSADNDLLAVIDAMLPGLSSGKVVVDMSTVGRDTARTAAERVAKRGAAFLDAPVSGGVEGAHNGQLAIMVGGDTAVLESVRPALDAMGTRIAHMGPVGAGQATKAVNQVMAAGINQAVTEALAFAEALELPLEKVIEVVGSGAAGNWFLNHRGPTMVQSIFEPGFKLALHDKDLGICQQMAAQFDAAMPVVEMTRVHYRRLMEQGFGEEDISALFREKQRLFFRKEAKQ